MNQPEGGIAAPTSPAATDAMSLTQRLRMLDRLYRDELLACAEHVSSALRSDDALLVSRRKWERVRLERMRAYVELQSRLDALDRVASRNGVHQ